jgi:thiaminase/transcriptional activator TenA
MHGSALRAPGPGSVRWVQATQLIEAHRDLWQAATEPAFLAGVRDGSLDPHLFGSWLAQDYLFASALLSFQARLVARAPRAAQPALARGVVALVDELAWFESQAVQRDVALATVAAPTTLEYLALLGRLDTAPTQVALVALWALERVYLDGWRAAQPGAGAYREIVEHWTTPAFADYVAELERLVDDSLAEALSQRQQDVFAEVLRLEVAFWDAAVTAP